MVKVKMGDRIRRYREARGLSRPELAQRTGLDEAFLALLEEEDVSPSLGPLLKVARALGVRLGTFMDDEIGSDICLLRCGEGRGEDAGMRKAKAGGRPLGSTLWGG